MTTLEEVPKKKYNINYSWQRNCRDHSSSECLENEKNAKVAWDKLIAADAKKNLWRN